MSAKRKKTIYDGFFYKNPVLIGGLIAGPVIVYGVGASVVYGLVVWLFGLAG